MFYFKLKIHPFGSLAPPEPARELTALNQDLLRWIKRWAGNPGAKRGDEREQDARIGKRRDRKEGIWGGKATGRGKREGRKEQCLVSCNSTAYCADC